MSNPNDYSPPKSREPLPPHVEHTPAKLREGCDYIPRGIMRATFWVPGPLPGQNEMIAAAKSGRGKGNAYSRQKALWTSVVARWARSRRLGRFALPVTVTCVWHEATARRDPDNVHAGVKFVLDGLVQAQVLAGDGRAQIAEVRHSVLTASPPGVQITIETKEADTQCST